MKYDILSRFTGKVQFTAEIECGPDTLPSVRLGFAVRVAVKSRAYLSGADLRGAYLSGADLSGADLRGADLSGADLRGADLRGAYLSGANLSGADLRGAYLRGAYLSGADLRGAYLRGAYLSGAYLRGAYLSGADLRGAYLSGADLSGAYLSGANLSGADLSGADLGGADLGTQWIIQGATRSDGYAFFLQKLKDDSEPMVKAGCRYFTLSQAEAHWKATRGGTALFKETEIIVRAMVDLAYARGLMTAPVREAAE